MPRPPTAWASASWSPSRAASARASSNSRSAVVNSPVQNAACTNASSAATKGSLAVRPGPVVMNDSVFQATFSRPPPPGSLHAVLAGPSRQGQVRLCQKYVTRSGGGSVRPGLEQVEVPFGVEPVLPLLGEDGLQAPPHREALRFGIARFGDRHGPAGQPVVGEAGEHLANRGHAIRAQGEYLIERWPRLAVVRDARLVVPVVGQVQRIPGRRVSQ